MTDSCPSCVRRRIPPAAHRTRGAATVTGYRCPRGHTWATSRLTAAYTAPNPRKDAV
jgi:CxxC motif-containing protein